MVEYVNEIYFNQSVIGLISGGGNSILDGVDIHFYFHSLWNMSFFKSLELSSSVLLRHTNDSRKDPGHPKQGD